MAFISLVSLINSWYHRLLFFVQLRELPCRGFRFGLLSNHLRGGTRQLHVLFKVLHAEIVGQRMAEFSSAASASGTGSSARMWPVMLQRCQVADFGRAGRQHFSSLRLQLVALVVQLVGVGDAEAAVALVPAPERVILQARLREQGTSSSSKLMHSSCKLDNNPNTRAHQIQDGNVNQAPKHVDDLRQKDSCKKNAQRSVCSIELLPRGCKEDEVPSGSKLQHCRLKSALFKVLHSLCMRTFPACLPTPLLSYCFPAWPLPWNGFGGLIVLLLTQEFLAARATRKAGAGRTLRCKLKSQIHATNQESENVDDYVPDQWMEQLLDALPLCHSMS